MQISAGGSSSAAQFSVPNTTIPISQMLRAPISGAKVGVNVTDFSVYTRFKHISPMPVSGSGGGYSASRLRILDAVIDRLVKLREHSLEQRQDQDVSGLSEESLDQMIEQYLDRYKSLSKQSAQQLGETQGANFGMNNADMGWVLNLLA